MRAMRTLIQPRTDFYPRKREITKERRKAAEERVRLEEDKAKVRLITAQLQQSYPDSTIQDGSQACSASETESRSFKENQRMIVQCS